MVILGGLEIVAAGYLIHKHQQNKRDKQRIADEAFAPNRPASSTSHRRRRSHSRESSGRHSDERRNRRDRHDRPHSTDGKYTHDNPPRRDSAPRPSKQYANVPLPQQQAPVPVYHTQVPVPIITHSIPPPPQQTFMHPPPPPLYSSVPTATYGPPQDMKYGWTDEPARPPPQQDPDSPPTGWPAHWSQSQTPPTLQPQRGESSSRRDRRSRTPEPNNPRVRFDVPGSVRSSSRSPPPSYRG